MAGGLLALWAVCAAADTGHRDFPGLTLDTTTLPENFNILGKVVDAFNQLPVSGAKVKFAGTIEIYTDLDGNFEFRNIDSSTYLPGDYSIAVSHEGYTSVVRTTAIPPVSPITIPIGSNTVILLHGINSDSGSWYAEWEPSQSFYSVLDRGFYNVITPNFDLSCAQLRTNASVLFLELWNLHNKGIQSYSIVGHSAGGLVARWYLTNFPEHGDLGLHVQKLITLGTPHHGSPLAILAHSRGADYAFTIGNVVRSVLCDNFRPIIEELIPGNATLNLLNYGRSYVSGETAPCNWHIPESRIGIDPSRVYCIAGKHPETARTRMLSELLALKYGCPDNDGVVPIESAFLAAVPPQNQWLDEELPFPCATEHFLGPYAFLINPCIANAVKDILDGTPPVHKYVEPAAKSSVERHQFLPTISHNFESGESLIDSSLVYGLSQAMFMCTWSGDSLDYYLETPSGQTITGLTSAGDPNVTWLADDLGAMYLIDSPEPGLWKHLVSCPPTVAPGTLHLITSFDSQLDLSAIVTPEVSPTGVFACTAQFTRSGLVLPAARVVVEVVMPDAGVETVQLVDDGTWVDPVPGDGEYWGEVAAEGQSGVFSFLVNAVEDSTQTASETREVQQVGMARSYSSIEAPSAEFVIESQDPGYGSLVGLESTFRNIGTAPADSVLLMIENMRYGLSLADTVVALAPGEAFTLHASWMAAAVDTTRFRAVAVVLQGNIDDNPADNVALSWASVTYPDIVSAVPGDPVLDPGRPGEGLVGSQIGIAPNPLNGGTELRFVLATASQVKLTIFDLAGRLVRALVDGRMEAGQHTVRWDGLNRTGSPVSSGIYLCRLEVAGKTLVAKMAVIK